MESEISTKLTSNQWFEFVGDRQAFSYGSIHIVQELCLRVGGIEIGSFTCIHYRAPSHSHKQVKFTLGGKVNGIFKTAT